MSKNNPKQAKERPKTKQNNTKQAKTSKKKT